MNSQQNLIPLEVINTRVFNIFNRLACHMILNSEGLNATYHNTIGDFAEVNRVSDFLTGSVRKMRIVGILGTIT